MTAIRTFRSSTAFDLALIASTVLPLTVVSADPARALVGAIVSGVALVSSSLRRDWRFWVVLAGLYGIWYWSDWRTLDNHAWLMPVWFSAVAVSRFRPDSEETLRTQARLLVALVFTFAMVWKLRSPDFSSGAFFEFTLLTDPRFAPLAEWLGVSRETLAINQTLVASGPDPALLVGGESVRGLATLLTAGTLVIESSVAVTWGVSRIPTVARHASLALFCAATYVIAPVAGFGLILLAMGSAEAQSTRGARWYLAGMAGLFVWSAIWNALVL